MNINSEQLPIGLPEDIFDSLPEFVHYYIRFLEASIQRLEKQVQVQDQAQKFKNKPKNFMNLKPGFLKTALTVVREFHDYKR